MTTNALARNDAGATSCWKRAFTKRGGTPRARRARRSRAAPSGRRAKRSAQGRTESGESAASGLVERRRRELQEGSSSGMAANAMPAATRMGSRCRAVSAGRSVIPAPMPCIRPKARPGPKTKPRPMHAPTNPCLAAIGVGGDVGDRRAHRRQGRRAQDPERSLATNRSGRCPTNRSAGTPCRSREAEKQQRFAADAVGRGPPHRGEEELHPEVAGAQQPDLEVGSPKSWPGRRGWEG